MQVDHASIKGVNEWAFYYPHEACEYDQLWGEALDALNVDLLRFVTHACALKAWVEEDRGHFVFFSKRENASIFMVAN